MTQGRHKHIAEHYRPTGEPKPPRELRGKARSLFKRLAAELPLTSIDTHTLAAYCRCVQRWEEAEAIIEADGLDSPAVKIADQLLRHIRAFGTELGLTPKARAKFELPTKPIQAEAERLEALRILEEMEVAHAMDTGRVYFFNGE